MGAEQEQGPVECDRLGRPLQPHAFGRPGVKCGRSKGSRNKYPRELVLAVLNAAAKVGYDRDVLVRDKKGNPLLDKKGNCIIDKSKRIGMTLIGVRRLTVRPGPAGIAILQLYAVGPGIPVLRASDRLSGTYISKTSGSPAWASVSRERYELNSPQ